MLPTPWGDAEKLRQRRLPPGRSGDREAARRDQRERLFAATVASCAEKGFDATSVEDLLRISGVSRATFYEQFDDKLDCFRAAEDEIVTRAIAAAAAPLGGEGKPLERARVALETFLGLIVAQPLAARMCLVEAYAAGEAGIAPVREAIERLGALSRGTVEQTPGRAAMPPELVRGIVGGIYQVIYMRLLTHREEELPELAEPLWDWATSFAPPPRELRRAGRLNVVTPVPTAPPFAAFSVEQRILRGLASAAAEKGYPGTTIADNAGAAAISQTTFYEYFDGKAEALAAALASSGAQLEAAALPSARRLGASREAVRVGFEEICGFFAAEPALARLRMVEVYSAGPEAIEQRDSTGTGIVRTLLSPAITDLEAVPDLVVEATVGAILGVLFEGIRAGRPEELPKLAPVLTYLALSPFVGAEAACEVANGRGRKPPQPSP
jgi:AcrR family transcriptional regulator